jgi:hypothetical protein
MKRAVLAGPTFRASEFLPRRGAADGEMTSGPRRVRGDRRPDFGGAALCRVLEIFRMNTSGQTLAALDGVALDRQRMGTSREAVAWKP